MDFKTFYEQNKKACLGGLAGAVVVLIGIAAVAGKGHNAQVETTAPATEAVESEKKAITVDRNAGSFYAKIADSQPVSVLVLGDSFAKGNNLSDVSSSWAELLPEKFQTEFSADLQIENYALPSDNGVFSGFVEANEIPDGSEYDAVILSFGEYDDPETFAVFYEGIIRNLQKKCPEISIISLIEPSSETNPDGHAAANASAIQNITDHYNGLTIDVAKEMAANGGNAKDTADSDKIGQNDEGNAKTADIIISSIMNFKAAKDAVDASSIEALDENAAKLESYAYITASDFAKVNDTTYELPAELILDVNGEPVSGILGVDFNYQPGANDVYVSVDGTPFGRSTTEFKGTEAEQHVVLINDNFAPSEYVTVSFGTAAEAESFAGIIVSGDITLPDSYDKFESKEIQELDAAALSELMGDAANGGPGSDDVEEEVEEPEENNGPQDGDTKTVDGVLYEYFEGEWYEVINDDTGNPNVGVKQEVVETRSAGQVITNKEVVRSEGQDAATAETESVAETSAEMTETSVAEAVETSAETVAETAAAEVNAEAQAAESSDMAAADPNAVPVQ